MLYFFINVKGWLNRMHCQSLVCTAKWIGCLQALWLLKGSWDKAGWKPIPWVSLGVEKWISVDYSGQIFKSLLYWVSGWLCRISSKVKLEWGYWDWFFMFDTCHFLCLLKPESVCGLLKVKFLLLPNIYFLVALQISCLHPGHP